LARAVKQQAARARQAPLRRSTLTAVAYTGSPDAGSYLRASNGLH
jgi:hypothetical protein